MGTAALELNDTGGLNTGQPERSRCYNNTEGEPQHRDRWRSALQFNIGGDLQHGRRYRNALYVQRRRHAKHGYRCGCIRARA